MWLFWGVIINVFAWIWSFSPFRIKIMQRFSKQTTCPLSLSRYFKMGRKTVAAVAAPGVGVVYPAYGQQVASCCSKHAHTHH